MIIEQKVFNMYRHHSTSMLEVLEGPVPERQLMLFKEYLEDILWFLSDSTNGNIVMPECELQYLNSKVLELKNKGLLNQKISIESGAFLIKCSKKDKNDILNLLEFFTEIFNNEIRRDIFYKWDSDGLILNKELQLKDSVLNTFYDSYVQGILSKEAIKKNINSLTVFEEHILKSSIDVFSDYKIWSLFLLTDKNTALMPHLMNDFSKKLETFNLRRIRFGLTDNFEIQAIPEFEMFKAVDFKIFIHFNDIKFTKNSSMSYQNISNSYIMETHSGEIY